MRSSIVVVPDECAWLRARCAAARSPVVVVAIIREIGGTLAAGEPAASVPRASRCAQLASVPAAEDRFAHRCPPGHDVNAATTAA
jgi:hypothetical protein